MPRVSYVSSLSFISGYQNHSPENENFDLCQKCFPKIKNNVPEMRRYFDIPKSIPDQFIDADGEQEHPDYEGERYRCALCDKTLDYYDN